MRNAVDRWSKNPWIDAAIGTTVSLAYLGWRLAEQAPLAVLGPGDRGTLYATIAGLAGALLAFGLTPVAIVLALAPGPRLKALLRHHDDELRRGLMFLLGAVLILLVVTVVALATDTGSHSARWVRYLVLASAVPSGLGVARVILQFDYLLRNVSEDRGAETRQLKRVDKKAS